MDKRTARCYWYIYFRTLSVVSPEKYLNYFHSLLPENRPACVALFSSCL